MCPMTQYKTNIYKSPLWLCLIRMHVQSRKQIAWLVCGNTRSSMTANSVCCVISLLHLRPLSNPFIMTLSIAFTLTSSISLSKLLSSSHHHPSHIIYYLRGKPWSYIQAQNNSYVCKHEHINTGSTYVLIHCKVSLFVCLELAIVGTARLHLACKCKRLWKYCYWWQVQHKSKLQVQVLIHIKPKMSDF